jgi:hypothetical protein
LCGAPPGLDKRYLTNPKNRSSAVTQKRDVNDPHPLSPLVVISNPQLLKVELSNHRPQMRSSDNDETQPISLDKYADMTLHAQELNFEELHEKMDSLLNDSETTLGDPFHPEKRVIQETSITEINDDDILPSESFSTRASPAGSVVNGVVHTKPPISIFETKPNPSESHEIKHGSRSAHDTSVSQSDRTKDDKPARFSDVESSPPMKAAGFEGDEIPTVDPLDSDGEWGPTPTHTGLPTAFALSQLGSAQGQDLDTGRLEMVEEKRKKRKKKKSKGVSSLPREIDFRLKAPKLWRKRTIALIRLLGLKSFTLTRP